MAIGKLSKSVVAVEQRNYLEIILATTLIACKANYSVGINPSQTFLQPVLSESGQLLNNWQSEIQPQSFWFFTQVFAQIPPSLLTKFVLASWIAQILVIVICCKLILEKKKVVLNLRIVGYVLIAVTLIPGLGSTSGIISVFYPTNFAFSMACVLITAIIFQKNVLIGVSAGLVTLSNPSTGLIAIIVFLVPLLVIKLRNRVEIASIFLPFLTLSIPPIYFAIKRNLNALGLSEQERINLRVITRMPHHYQYESFPLTEYLSIGLWSLFILVAIKFMPKSSQNLILHSSILILILLMIASAIASLTSNFFFLIELRPLRLSPIITFMGFLYMLSLSQILLTKLRIQIFSCLVLSIAILQLIVRVGIFPFFNKFTGISSPTVFETLVMSLFLFSLVRMKVSWDLNLYQSKIHLMPRALFFLYVLTSLIHVAPDFNKSRSSIEMNEIYNQANKRTMPGDIFMIPPSWDSFSYFTKRAVIIEWAPNPFGRGEYEYIQRLNEVVGNRELFNLRHPTSMKIIDEKMVPLYEKNLEYSLQVLCKYNAMYVVSTNPRYSNRFLKPVFSNSSGSILKLDASCI
jgi:hypothetical protein